MEAARLKKCSRCDKSLPHEAFHKNSSKYDGLESSCKTCVSKRKKTKYSKDQKALKHRQHFESHLVGTTSDPDCFIQILGAAIVEGIEDGKF